MTGGSVLAKSKCQSKAIHLVARDKKFNKEVERAGAHCPVQEHGDLKTPDPTS
jgi:hypothetical protein